MSALVLLASTQARKLSQMVGNAERLGAALRLHQHVEAFGVELRPGQHHLGARTSPPENGRLQALAWNSGTTIRIESRAVSASASARIGGEAVQHGRAMAVEHALRIARRAGGVAERAGGVLVEARPDEVGRGARSAGPRSTAGWRPRPSACAPRSQSAIQPFTSGRCGASEPTSGANTGSKKT